VLQTIIIGKNSNLSEYICKKVINCFLVSAREILINANVLAKFKIKNINIIFNNFQPATQLNNLDNCTEYINSSILVTSMVLDYFKDTNINKIIYTSSSSVYGNNMLCKESDELKPMNLHASLKVANEKLIEKYSIDNKIDYSIARIFNMYGGDDKFSVICKIISSHKNNSKLTIVNDGDSIRDFIHIDDVVEIYLDLLKVKNMNIVNIGTGCGSSIKNILDYLSNNGIKVDIQNIYKDELKVSIADNSLLNKNFHKDNFIKIEDYLKEKFSL